MIKLKNILANFCTVLVAIAFAPVIAAEEPNLLGAESIKCDFDKGAVVEYDGEDTKVSFANFGEGGAASFTSINLEKREAIMSGISGKSAVVVLFSIAGLTFIEKSGFGNLVFTTVFLLPQEDGSFPAVTSRHVAGLGGSPIPSQYYGICKIAE